jgi:hypothetical protein
MQPSYVTFYGPLKAVFDKESDLFIKTKGLRVKTPCGLATVFKQALYKKLQNFLFSETLEFIP